MCSVGQVVFVGMVAPYKTTKANKIELLNEVLTMFIMYHIFCFTDYVPEEEMRYRLGYSCLAFNFVHLALNIYHIFKDQIKELNQSMKLKYSIYY